MKLILLGDSFTQGYLTEPGEGWADRLCADNDGDYTAGMFGGESALLPGWSVENHGMNGDTAMGMDLRLKEQILADDNELPDRVLITGGINDLIYGGTGADVTHFYASMIMAAVEHGVQPIIGLEPAIDPNLAGVFWMEGINYFRVADEQKELTEDLRTMAKENGLYTVDFYRAVETIKAQHQGRRVYQDGLHLIPEVHVLLSEYAAAELIQIPLPL